MPWLLRFFCPAITALQRPGVSVSGCWQLKLLSWQAGLVKLANMQLFRRISFWLSLCGIAAGIMLITQIQQKTVPSQPVIAPALNPYESAVAGSGLLEANSENILIGAPMPGLVQEVAIKTGQKVQAGQLLFALDDRELKARLLVEKANLEQQKAALLVADSETQRAKKLLDRLANSGRGTVAVKDIEEREQNWSVAASRVLQAQAGVKAAEAQILLTERLLERMLVRSPIDGTILQNRIRAGQYISPNQGDMHMVLGNIEPLHLRVDIDEQNAHQIAAGMQAIASIKGRSDKQFKVRIVRIEPYVIPKKSLTGAPDERVDTRVLQVVFVLDEKPGFPVYVGQQVDVFIDLKNQQPASGK